jgi:pimeloyl-ACP methyl ester carboxylesterase
VEAFSKDKYSLYAFDAPGHGLSSGTFLSVPLYAGLIHLFIRQQGPFQAVLSHSLGSFSLLYALHTYASVPIKKVIILASPGNAEEFFAFYQQALRLSQKGLHSTIRQFENTFGQSPSEFLTSQFATSLQVPGLIIHDEEDLETPLVNAHLLHASWPESHLSITSGLGHQLKSTAVVKQVHEFVEES